MEPIYLMITYLLQIFDWSDIIINDDIFHLVQPTESLTTVYTLDGDPADANNQIQFIAVGTEAMTFGTDRYYSLIPSPASINTYDLPSNTLLNDESFSLNSYTTELTPNNVQFVDNYFFVTYPESDTIISFDHLGNLVRPQSVPMATANPRGMMFIDNNLAVVDTAFVREYPVYTNLDDITDLRGSSDDFQSITIYWSAPLLPIPITGYQINYTNPYSNDPNFIVINNTQSDTTSVKITNLSVGVEYSFRIAPYTEFEKGKLSNVLNYTTLHSLEVGSIDLTASNPDRASIRFNSIDEGDKYFSSCTLF